MNETKKAALLSGEVVELLKEIEHELTFLNGLVATDRPDSVHIPADLAIRIDESALICRVNSAISGLSCTGSRLS